MTPPPTPLRPWSRAWRYLAAVAVGAVTWIGYAAVLGSGPLTDAQRDRIGTVLAVDLLVGGLAVALLVLRRRAPLVVACVAVAAAAFSVASLGAMIVATVSMGTHRRRGWAVTVGVVAVIGGTAAPGLYHPWFSPAGHSAGEIAANALVVLLIVAIAVASGSYLGERRDLLASLHERALTAEREQALVAQAARAAERTRIAREMHDDLAHRISLVALHAGALAYREDLNRAETAATAQTIRSNAQLALTELRQVLGVLRDGDPETGTERSQPTLAELPALLADAREAGSTIRFDASGLPARLGHGVPETLSRTSFRVVQEALTNARKHAPGEPVGVRLTGVPGQRLGIEVRNPVGTPATARPPSAGVGLAGLGERAVLVGGTLDHGVEGGDFVVRASLPWPA